MIPGHGRNPDVYQSIDVAQDILKGMWGNLSWA